MAVPGKGRKAVGRPLPQPFPQPFAPSFTFYFRCHGFRILGESRSGASASPGRKGSSPAAGFPVLRAFSIYWVREGSCAAFGLQFHFNFFFFLCLSLNIQSITLAQCMSPKILQGFHGLGRRVGTVSSAVPGPGAASSAYTNKPTSRLPSCPPRPQPVSLLRSVTLPEVLADGRQAQRLGPDPCRGGHRQRTDGQVPTQRSTFTASATLLWAPVCPLRQVLGAEPTTHRQGQRRREAATSDLHFFRSPSVLKALRSTLNSCPPFSPPDHRRAARAGRLPPGCGARALESAPGIPPEGEGSGYTGLSGSQPVGSLPDPLWGCPSTLFHFLLPGRPEQEHRISAHPFSWVSS